MKIQISFLGAAQNVTGSRHLLEVNGSKILVDCGFYQERDLKNRNWDPFPVEPSAINAVLLTHAHLDHCGLLPKLVKDGFKGRIYCTEATAEIAKIILLDSAKIQTEDLEYKKKRHAKQGKKSPFPYEPLYTIEDAEKCFPHFSKTRYNKTIDLENNIDVTFHDAGHVLGSSIIQVKVRNGNEARTILFSGDMGRPNRPIVCDPAVFENADYVLIESTYGNRDHAETGNIKQQIADVINETLVVGGNIIVPSFALERAQEILYYIDELLMEEKIPKIRMFLDSPMAARITKVFRKHPELMDKETVDLVKNHESPFNLSGLGVTETAEQSKSINDIKSGALIIAGSGMCTGGRVKHHLVNNISRPECTIMFVGYQAIGTLGRSIVDGAKSVRILGQKREVNARIVRIQGFSAHADRNELLAWLKNLKTPPKCIYVIHGEKESAESFGEFVRKDTGWNTVVPQYQQQITLE